MNGREMLARLQMQLDSLNQQHQDLKAQVVQQNVDLCAQIEAVKASVAAAAPVTKVGVV